MSRPWSVREERFIAENMGRMPLRQMALKMGRSYEALRYHVHLMRRDGKVEGSARLNPDYEFISDLVECSRCYTPRTEVDEEGACPVCRAKDRLREHELKMHRAYENLPRELKERTNGTFRIERAPALMSKSKSLARPKKPDIEGLDAFWAAVKMDRWYRALEAYEMARLTLDIDATKQRTSKWRRKARKWREEHK